MLNPFRHLVLRIAKVPPEPPAPFGDEESLLVFRAAPNYYKYRVVVWLLGQLTGGLLWIIGAFTLGGFGIAAMVGDDEIAGILLVLACIAGLVIWLVSTVASYLMLRLDYELRWYKITDRSLRIREGVVLVREMTMTFANIQNISITQGPLQRMLGIADLKVQTAGGGGGAEQARNQPGFHDMHVGYFRGVDNAERIREIMIERLRRYRDAGLGDSDDRAGELHAAVSVHAEGKRALLEEIRAEAARFRAAAEAVAGRT